MLSEIKHPHIVELLGACSGDETILITSYCNAGSLYGFLHGETHAVRGAERTEGGEDGGRGGRRAGKTGGRAGPTETPLLVLVLLWSHFPAKSADTVNPLSPSCPSPSPTP